MQNAKYGKEVNTMRWLRIAAMGFILVLMMTGCSSRTTDKMNSGEGSVEIDNETIADGNIEDNGEVEKEGSDHKVYSLVKVNEETTYQEIESFGVSGAWWAQYVGGWDEPYGDDTEPVRDKIARLLYSRDTGIGLTAYRYNLGAGSVESGNGDFWYEDRRAQSFLNHKGEYDFTKDENAVWFLKKVVELGATEITLFSNSPLESLTVNGMAHMSEKGKVNILPENYSAFANYVYDVAEHFLSEGIPVTFLSPINEPQWDWLNGQEGCHYEPDEVVAVLKVFVEELEKRQALTGVELSAPESGEWGGRTIEYNDAILRDEILGEYFETMDNHSYWSDAASKKKYQLWKDQNYPHIKLRMSEWCEMVNGTDYTMDSAFNMFDVIYDDMTILDVVSWQCWVGVAPGDYRDGLIYVNKEKKACRPAKRLWAFGNLTKYVRPGYTRVEVANNYTDIYKMKSLAYTGTNEEGKKELVLVFVNREEEKNFKLSLSDVTYGQYEIVTTSEQRDLEQVEIGDYTENTVITVEAESITTVILREK